MRLNLPSSKNAAEYTHNYNNICWTDLSLWPRTVSGCLSAHSENVFIINLPSFVRLLLFAFYVCLYAICCWCWFVQAAICRMCVFLCINGAVQIKRFSIEFEGIHRTNAPHKTRPNTNGTRHTPIEPINNLYLFFFVVRCALCQFYVSIEMKIV